MNVPRNRLFWAVALGHMTNDMFVSMIPVLLAFISVAILPMSNTQIGLTVSATQLVAAISQPGFGLLADRSGGRWLAAGGVGWTVSLVLLGLVGAQTGYYWLMAVPFVMAMLGSGAFHPAGAMTAADSDRARVASNMSYFFLMGQLGLALGPALAGLLLDLANPSTQGLFIAPFSSVIDSTIRWEGTVSPIYGIALLAFPAVAFMGTALPGASRYKADQLAQNGGQPAKKTVIRLPWKALSILVVMVVLRSLGQPGSVAFIPVLFQSKGWTPAEYGAITSSFWIASGVAGVLFGNLADYIDRRWVVTISMLLAAPAFFLLPLADGAFAFVLAMAAGGLSGGSHSIIVVLAQEMIPAAKGFASGMILGLIFGAGAVGSAIIGTVSDAIGLNTTFQIVAGFTVVAGFIALALPVREKPSPPAVLDEGEVSPARAG